MTWMRALPFLEQDPETLCGETGKRGTAETATWTSLVDDLHDFVCRGELPATGEDVDAF